MNKNENLPQHIKEIYDEGCSLRDKLIELLKQWPVNPKNPVHPKPRYSQLSAEYKSEIEKEFSNIRRWFNTLSVQVLPYTIYSKDALNALLSNLERTMKDRDNDGPSQVEYYVGKALELIDTLPASLITTNPMQQSQQIK